MHCVQIMTEIYGKKYTRHRNLKELSLSLLIISMIKMALILFLQTLTNICKIVFHMTVKR